MDHLILARRPDLVIINRKRKLAELWTNVIVALGMVIKGLAWGLEDSEIRGQVETTQTTAFLRSARILRRIL